MPITIQLYILRELTKMFLLAIAGITMILVVFGVMRQAQSEGLTPQQILTVLPYLIPVSMPITIPVTALLAVTQVYGRMAADNEKLGEFILEGLRPAPRGDVRAAVRDEPVAPPVGVHPPHDVHSVSLRSAPAPSGSTSRSMRRSITCAPRWGWSRLAPR